MNNSDLVVVVEFSPELVTGSGHSSEDFVALVASLKRRIQIIDHRAKQCVDCDLDTLRRKAETARQLDLLLTRQRSHCTPTERLDNVNARRP